MQGQASTAAVKPASGLARWVQRGVAFVVCWLAFAKVLAFDLLRGDLCPPAQIAARAVLALVLVGILTIGDRGGRVAFVVLILGVAAWLAFVDVHPRKSFSRAARQVELGMTPAEVHALMGGFLQGPEGIASPTIVRLKLERTPNAVYYEAPGEHHSMDEFLWVEWGPDGRAARVVFSDD